MVSLIFGKYAAYNGNANAADLGVRPAETGIYGNIGGAGGKNGYLSSEQLGALGSGLGLAAMLAAVTGMIKSSKETNKVFEEKHSTHHCCC